MTFQEWEVPTAAQD
jgi:hypothetical protein